MDYKIMDKSSNYMDKITKEHRDYAEYMTMRYGSSYMSAIWKLNSKDAYDEKGYLRSEYALTDKEREALHFYTPDMKEFFDKYDISSSESKKR